MASTLFFSSMQRYITQSAWLPKVHDYVAKNTWRDLHVETTATKISAAGQDKYRFSKSTNYYSFKRSSTGAYCVYTNRFNDPVRYALDLIIPHLFGVVSMMVLDVLAAGYALLQLPYNVLTVNGQGAYTNIEQGLIRLTNCLAKPLQWGGLLLSIMVRMWHADSADKMYLSLERDMYLGVFNFGPLVPLLDKQDDGADESLLSELVSKANSEAPEAYNGRNSMHFAEANQACITKALNIPSRDTLSSEDQNAQTALLGKIGQMKDGDTLEDIRISLVR
jgi:hypothetical protein